MGDVRGEGYLRLIAECLSQLEPEVLEVILTGRLAEGWDLEGLLRQVSCPALLVQGEPALGGLEDQVAERAAALLPHGQRIKIPGAGHNIHQTQPEAILRAAQAFLAPV